MAKIKRKPLRGICGYTEKEIKMRKETKEFKLKPFGIPPTIKRVVCMNPNCSENMSFWVNEENEIEGTQWNCSSIWALDLPTRRIGVECDKCKQRHFIDK